MRRTLSLLAASLVALVVSAPGGARAEGPSSFGAKLDVPRQGAAAPSYWQLGLSRPFLSSTIDLGLLYLRPQLALGYGRPHFFWAGIEAYPSISSSNTSEYLGLRAALRYVDVRVGARYVFTVDRRFLPPQYSYTRDEIEPRFTAHSRYVALDGEVSLSVPLVYGGLLATVTGHAIFDVPAGYYVFEEGLKVVVKPPFVGRARLGYVIRVGPDDDVTLGAFGELVSIPDRKSVV